MSIRILKYKYEPMCGYFILDDACLFCNPIFSLFGDGLTETEKEQARNNPGTWIEKGTEQ